MTFSGATHLLIAVIGDSGIERDGVADADFSGLFRRAAGVAYLPCVVDDQTRLRTLQDHAPDLHRALVRWDPVEGFPQQVEGFSTLSKGRAVQVALVSPHDDDMFTVWNIIDIDEADAAVVVHVYGTADMGRIKWRVAGSRKSPPDTKKSYRIR